jgi:hypothetical protein
MRWAGHVECKGERRGVHRVFVGKTEGKRPLGKPRRRWEENIQMDLQELGCGVMDWIEVAQDRESWRALVNAVMNLQVPENYPILLTQYCSGDRIETNKMAGHVGYKGERRGVYRVLWGNLKERDHLGDPGVDGRKIFRWISRNLDVGLWTGSSWLWIGTGVGHL